MIYHRERYLAIEYESSQKSKDRYRSIFLDYAFDKNVDRVLYIVSTPELADKISKATLDEQHYFVSYEDLLRDGIHVQLKSNYRSYTLRQMIEASS